MIIEKERILVENGNRAHGIGALNIQSFVPFPKNPTISAVFREIGYADELCLWLKEAEKLLAQSKDTIFSLITSFLNYYISKTKMIQCVSKG